MAEIVEWRLADYLQRSAHALPTKARLIGKVSHAGGRPIIFLPDRTTSPGMPSGWTDILADGERYEANFVKVAVNVVRRKGSSRNELPEILRRWFGPHAGRPGTNHHVIVEMREDVFELRRFEDEANTS